MHCMNGQRARHHVTRDMDRAHHSQVALSRDRREQYRRNLEAKVVSLEAAKMSAVQELESLQ